MITTDIPILALSRRLDPHEIPRLSPRGLTDQRAAAASAAYPRDKILLLLADLSEAAGELDAARADLMYADTEAANDAATEEAAKAGLRVAGIQERIDEECDRAAESQLSLSALAYARRPGEYHDQMRHQLASLLSPLRQRIDDLAKRVANLEAVLVQREEYA